MTNNAGNAEINEQRMKEFNLEQLNIDSDCVLKFEVDKIKGLYYVTLKFHHIGVKYTFDIDDDTFKNINVNVMKLIAKDYKQLEYECDPLID